MRNKHDALAREVNEATKQGIAKAQETPILVCEHAISLYIALQETVAIRDEFEQQQAVRIMQLEDRLGRYRVFAAIYVAGILAAGLLAAVVL